MMSLQISYLRQLDGVTVHAGIESCSLDPLMDQLGLHFPLEHREVLNWSNGVEVYDGYFRLFGMNTEAGIDSVAWNQEDYWKFAWRNRCTGFWCFGETIWGDQYAYSIDLLRNNLGSPIYFMDAVSMNPEVVANSFSEFFEREFVRSACHPYDDLICSARKKFGAIDANQHLVYMPSLLLGGVDSIENVHAMNARAAMICNGDIAVQLDDAPLGGVVKGVTTYHDPQSRMRIRIDWA